MPFHKVQQSKSVLPQGNFNMVVHSIILDLEVCSLPFEAGPCEGLEKRFFFDATTGHCQPFTYGGCEGNANRFHSLLECMNTWYEYVQLLCLTSFWSSPFF
jgi:hypothetical protein